MAGPENKENLESALAKPIQLPRADSTAIMSTQGAVQLPARPPELAAKDNDLDSQAANRLAAQAKLERLETTNLKETLLRLRIDDIGVLVARSEQERKAVLSVLFLGHNPDKEILKLVDSIILLSGNAALIDRVADGSINQEALAKHLLNYIAQQRGFGCSIQDLAMLDSLEFQLTQILRHLNPTIRIQQQTQTELASKDDEAASAGPGKVEDDRETSLSEREDVDNDTDLAPTPRSKRGKARARSRSRDRRNRFRRWLARMMRVFRGQAPVIPGTGRAQAKPQKLELDRRFIKTVRIFGRVTNAKTKVGIKGVKIISNSLGATETSADGSFAFENVTEGISYSLAPLKSGCSFTPLSVNDIALNSREHNFFMLED